MKNSLLITTFFICTLFLIACNKHKNIVKTNVDYASKQFDYALKTIDSVKQNDTRNIDEKKKNPWVSPRTFKNNQLKLVRPKDWTSGFFPGNLWFLYEKTGNEKWMQKAQEFTEKLSDLQTYTGTHDLGFMMYNSYGNGLRLTKNENYVPVLINSAKSLASRYKAGAKVIRSWDHNAAKWQCPVIIDNMMNLELLFWASKQTGDSTYYKIAVNHANTTMKNHFREDYSSFHVIDYDTITGEVLKQNTHQGFADESAWARGQAWGLYGYTICYRETNDTNYLNQANKIADFIFLHPALPEDLVPYWDYDAPSIPNAPRDASAAAITASALYELSVYDAENKEKYLKWADTIIENLTHNYRSPIGENGGFLLLHSTGSKPHNSEVDCPLVYADYYFLEALLRKQKIASKQPLF